MVDPELDVIVETPFPTVVPQDVMRRTTRGRKATLRDAVKRRLCMEFSRGNTYGYEDGDGRYQTYALSTNLNGSGKPSHRIRNKYDFIGPIIDSKVSAATQRTPSYDAMPSTTDPESIGAAKLAVKVALYGYDKWRYSIAKEKVFRLAIGGGGVGYAMPYFDANIGPYRDDGMGGVQGEGEIRIETYTGNEVSSEPGVEFEDSRWCEVVKAYPLDQIYDMPGFVKGIKLTADAVATQYPDSTVESDNLALVYKYYERPSQKYPDGRCVVSCNGRPIIDYRLIDPTEPYWWGCYPLQDHESNVLDEPLLHRLVYRHDGSKDSDLGLTWLLIDFERTIQDCYNKILEYKNRGLNPQMVAPVGSLIDRQRDDPGYTNYYKPVGGMKPEWETPVQVPQALFQIIDMTLGHMRDVAADNDFNADPNVAAKTVAAVDVQTQSKWEKFMRSVEEWDSRLMRHCLLLVSRFYTEQRVIAIRGRWGEPQRITDFTGRDLLGESNIRVKPGSTQQQSRQQIQGLLSWVQANWPGYLAPEMAIAAMQDGTPDNLIKGYQEDIDRVNGVIADIINGTLMDRPEWPVVVMMDRPLVVGGQPQIGPDGLPVIAPQPTQTMAPNWMPTPTDSIPIWKTVFGDWMKTDEYAKLPLAMQSMAGEIWIALETQEQQKAQQAQAAQMAQAVQLGQQNAAAAPVKGVPSQPGDNTPPAATPR